MNKPFHSCVALNVLAINSKKIILWRGLYWWVNPFMPAAFQKRPEKNIWRKNVDQNWANNSLVNIFQIHNSFQSYFEMYHRCRQHFSNWALSKNCLTNVHTYHAWKWNASYYFNDISFTGCKGKWHYSGTLWLKVIYELSAVNPSYAEATFVQSKDFWRPSKPCHVGIHWLALAEYSPMSTHVPGVQSFFRFFAWFWIGKISHHQHKG